MFTASRRDSTPAAEFYAPSCDAWNAGDGAAGHVAARRNASRDAQTTRNDASGDDAPWDDASGDGSKNADVTGPTPTAQRSPVGSGPDLKN